MRARVMESQGDVVGHDVGGDDEGGKEGGPEYGIGGADGGNNADGGDRGQLKGDHARAQMRQEKAVVKN